MSSECSRLARVPVTTISPSADSALGGAGATGAIAGRGPGKLVPVRNDNKKNLLMDMIILPPIEIVFGYGLTLRTGRRRAVAPPLAASLSVSTSLPDTASRWPDTMSVGVAPSCQASAVNFVAPRKERGMSVGPPVSWLM